MTLAKRIIAEFVGTAGILIVVAGSGIMGETLANGNSAIALLANSIATGAGLYALIQIFGPISGAHFNPVVSFTEFLRKKLYRKELIAFIVAQISGGFVGIFITHLMFGQNIFQLSVHNRNSISFFISEMIATFGLITVISFSGRKNSEKIPLTIALYITSTYWCTSSTSFANPAVTIARGFTNTFSGIQLDGVPGFIIAQFIGAGIAYLFSELFPKEH